MLLSPSLVQIPETLTDAETRAQSRHVDLLVNRGAADVLRLRSAVIGAIRDFFGQRHFTEVHTPILAAGAGGAAARSFRTRHTAAATAPGEDGGAGGKELRLRIAPELWLKRLVVGGLDRVFELGPAFRDEGTDATHNPEFYTCEFYQAYASLDDLMRTTEELVMALAEMTIRLRDGTGDGIATLAALPPLEPHDLLQRIVKARPFRRVEFIPELQRRLGWTLPDLAAPEAREELLALLEMHGVPQDLVRTGDGPSLAKLLDRLAGAFLETPSAAPDVQEGSFDPAAPFFIIHHPAVLSPLAKSFCCPVTGQLVAARAELFDPSSTLRKPSSSGEDDVHQCTSTGSNSSRELANMYEEENDPFEQRRKLAAQLAERGHDDGDDSTMTVDESYVAALEAGLPPTGGWGCGIERLVMLLSGSRRIADTLSFGILRNVVGLGHAKPRKVSHGR